jgi:hypothetical protein
MNLPVVAPAPKEQQKKKATQVKRHVQIQDENRQEKTKKTRRRTMNANG